MDGFTPGWGSGCCCEMDGCACESCAMGGARDSCAAWREHYYWNHMSDDNKQFLVVASGDVRHSLRIRQKIGGHLRNMISVSEPVKLEAPSGHVYPVEVRIEVGDIVLRSGWHKFAHAHQIEENFSILFMYRGDSTFKVQIFDSVGQERSFLCSQPPSGIFGAVPPRAPQYVLNEQVVPDPGHVQTSIDIVYTTWCHLTKAQDDKVLEIANTRKSEIPLHVAAMNKRNVNLKDSCVYIPLQLVLNHLKDEITEPTIQLEAPDKKVYRVGASKHNKDQVVLDSEWYNFVASLCIQENDLLIFISKGGSLLEVLILDPSGREKIVDPPPCALIDISSSNDDDIVREGKRKSCRAQKRVTRRCTKTQKMASTSSPSTKSGYGAREPHGQASLELGDGPEPLSNNIWWPSQRPYIIGQGKTLPSQVETKVVEKVQAIRSELPIYVKVMTTTNVDIIGTTPPEMTFSMRYGSACLPDQTQPIFLKMEGRKEVWPATLSVTSRKQRRVYIGWKVFVQDNHLKAGDICLFELASSNAGSLTPTMTVHLIHKSEAHM